MKNESNVNSYAKIFPVVFETANGDTITDETGKQYLDFFCGASVMNYGHNHPVFKQAITDFLASNNIVHCLDMDTKIKRTFLEKFNSVILRPRNLNYKIQFPGPTGTNAVEAAVRLSRIFTGRRTVISFTNSFHGMTSTSLALSGSREEEHQFIPPQNVIFFPYDKFLGENIDTVKYLEKMILTPGSGLEVPAAVIVETLQAEGGVNIASSEWLQDLRAFTERYKILLIIDDIQVGCGRTGSYFSFENAGIVPDIVLLSKSLSGFGLPLSLMLLKPEIDVWNPGQHNGTFRSNNLALCTASAALNFWENNDLLHQMKASEGIIKSHLQATVEGLNDIVGVRGKGMIWGIEFREQKITEEVSSRLFQQGLLIERCGKSDNVLKLLPPLNISVTRLKHGLSEISDAISQISEPAVANHSI